INEVTIIEKSGKADELNDLKVDVLLYSSSMTCDDKLDWVNPGGRVCDVVTEDGLHTEKSVMKRLTGNKSYFYCDINAMAEMQPTVMQTLLRKISSMCDEGVIRPISSTSFPIESYKEMAAKLTDGSLQNVTFEIQSKPSFAVNQAVGREIAFKKTVTYIIGGSEHALGQAFARWLCKKGARHIAMIANN
uniref:hypothetical protein n=1 Tax=Salmonella sp. s55004 TaxID=3159675 RepID=UPI00397EB658